MHQCINVHAATRRYGSKSTLLLRYQSIFGPHDAITARSATARLIVRSLGTQAVQKPTSTAALASDHREFVGPRKYAFNPRLNRLSRLSKKSPILYEGNPNGLGAFIEETEYIPERDEGSKEDERLFVNRSDRELLDADIARSGEVQSSTASLRTQFYAQLGDENQTFGTWENERNRNRSLVSASGAAKRTWKKCFDPIANGILENLNGKSTEEIYEQLRIAATTRDKNIYLCYALCRYLIHERHEDPNLSMYFALISVNTDASHGSVRLLKSILDEMTSLKIDLDANACHAVLQVLAVHPDYVLVNDILELMQTKWFQLTDEGHHSVAACLLRSAQYEMALERVEYMREAGISVESYLYDLLIYHLSFIGEREEVLRLLKLRGSNGDEEISAVMWSTVLDTAASTLDYETIAYVWKRQVQPGTLNPPTGVCLDVLNAAARQGDIELATDVFRLLSARRTSFDRIHYELLIEAYLQCGDLHGTFSILCLMQESNVPPEMGSMREIVNHLVQRSDQIEATFDNLRHLREHDDRTVPIAAVNVLIEASVRLGKSAFALDIYKAIKTIVPAGPNPDTFRLLLSSCVEAKERDIGFLLASELPVFKVVPDASIYNLMVSMSLLDEGDQGTQDALDYYHEASAHDIRLSFAARQAVLMRLAERADQRAWTVYADMQEEGTLSTQSSRHLKSLLTTAFAQSMSAAEFEENKS